MNKIFAVNKPKGITSYDVIRVLKKKYPGEKIGHGGTLDPLAQGVLVIGVGRDATKKLHTILRHSKKVYEAEIELGKVSKTDDSQGPVINYQLSITNNQQEQKSFSDVNNVLKSFVGEIDQVPPKYSAIKVRGLPAYKRARRGEDLILKPKKVQIYDIQIIQYKYPILKIKVICGSGVYIRSLARDIGQYLGTGAYLRNLTRTRVGKFDIDDCQRL